MKEQCIDGIHAKFAQNPLLQKMLLKTGNRVIVECCKDAVWGNGVPLHDDKCLDQSLWVHQGIMGEILEEIRSNLCLTSASNYTSTPEETVESKMETSAPITQQHENAEVNP